MGKLIVIEGTDSSGKQTQSEKLYERLEKELENVRKISFPNYSSPACEPVKMYLAGEFGNNAEEINPYPVSTMFAIDRYASYKKDWEDFYKKDGILITDRYVTSNMVHQASKIDNKEEKIKYLNWLEDLEYKKMNIPMPDMVIFLNMPTETANKLMEARKNKITGEDEKDIHEANKEYLKKSYENACEIAKLYNWIEISCVEGERLKSIDEIAEEIYSSVKKILK
ncbi:dTMP kinase [Cetobacterium sp. SF1]|uniref:dTMP kinase n=1 Tax=unclassified Cetobacterium TaxID=2630983 RepID=UPI003CF9DE1D